MKQQDKLQKLPSFCTHNNCHDAQPENLKKVMSVWLFETLKLHHDYVHSELLKHFCQVKSG